MEGSWRDAEKSDSQGKKSISKKVARVGSEMRNDTVPEGGGKMGGH